MNKSDLAEAVADAHGLSLTKAAGIVGTVLNSIQSAVAVGDKVTITGWGAFEQVHKPARTVRNPQGGDPIEVPESWAPKFKPGAEFKRAVNAGGKAAGEAR